MVVLQLMATSHPDTSFMYMIAGLCMLKLYQKRHPDINASAYSAYACLAVVIFFSVLGVVRPEPAMCLHTHTLPLPVLLFFPFLPCLPLYLFILSPLQQSIAPSLAHRGPCTSHLPHPL